MEKKNYVAPNMKVREIESEQLMAALSGSFSDDPAHGGGKAKSNDFPSEEENNIPTAVSNNIWSD